MKTFLALFVALGVATFAQAQPAPPAPPAPNAVARETVNYLIHVEWKDATGSSNSLEVLTTDGTVEFDGLQKNSVKINNNLIPVTLKLTATLNPVSEAKGRLQIFLGRTVPYVTSSMPGGGSSYSQMSVGLQSTFLVTFGKPVVIQSDENGTITVLVTRA